MRESVIYQAIFQEGRDEGLKIEALSFVKRQLTRRLGTLTPELEKQMGKLSVTQLENLGEALLDFSALTDLFTWLEVNQKS